MDGYLMTETEYKFVQLIWEKEPIGSGDLVRLCEAEFSWKKSTTYTVLKKLCINKILKNEDSLITSLIKQEEYHQIKSAKFVNDNFQGSLPKFLTAFMGKKKLSKKQAEEIRKIIDSYEEEK